MRTRSKLILVAVAAMVVFAASVTNASATRIEVLTSANGFRMLQSMVFSTSGFSAGPVTCTVTLEGAFTASTFTKTAGNLIGNATFAEVGNCRNGNATILNRPSSTTPWPVKYRSFTGTLPTITGIELTIERPEFDVEQAGFNCLAANETINGRITFERGAEANLRTAIGSTSEARISNLRSGGGFGCTTTTGELRGTGIGAPTYRGSATAIGIRLI